MKNLKLTTLLSVVLWGSFLSVAQAGAGTEHLQKEFQKDCQKLIETQGHENDNRRFDRLVKLYWDYQMTVSPEFATYVGDDRFYSQNAQWTDLSRAAIETRKKDAECALKATLSLSRKSLHETLNYDLFLRSAKMAVEGNRFPSELMPISQMGGVQQDVPNMLTQMTTAKVSDFENILSRLDKTPILIEQTIALMKEGVERKIVLPKITLRDVPQQILNVIPDKVEASALYQPFAAIHLDISAEQKTRLQTAARKVILEKVYPAYRKLHQFFVETYLPAARESLGWESLPDGKAWYQFAVKATTTTDLKPDEIHALGLSEVERIHKEMLQVKDQIGFSGSLKEFSEFLNSDSRFFYTSAEELLRGYRDIAKRIDPELAHVFGKLPRNPYGIKPVPAFAEKSQSTAYYEGGSVKAGRPGYFVANTYDLKSRPKWGMESLTLHEAVPGHHLQISLAQEMENVPEFRKYGDSTAFVEGWGLYAESLGKELGMYQDLYSYYGRLTFEIWRACRLVVDTGIHHLGWTRDQSIQYMIDNTGKAGHDIEVEVDRYIVWPGQALAYKIGELTFQRLKKNAKQQLGERFDLRKFHDALLSDGTLPLDVLEKKMKAWTDHASLSN